MSEKTKKVANETVEAAPAEEPAKKPVAKAKPKPATEKKENFLKRGAKKVRGWMSDHPVATAFTGAAIGSGLTVGACEAGKRILNNRRAAKQNSYIAANDELQQN